MQYAPIALFTYNRPDKTKTVIEFLQRNAEAKDSDLFIFSDGPKNEKAIEGVKSNREYIHLVQESSREFKWFKDVTIIERDKNWGLANSLIAGITELCEKYGRVIVVEDDLILSPYFLKFMNDGLNKYENDERVSAISGFLNPIDCEAPEAFFLRYFACWGWATWKRAWDLLNTDPKDLLRQLRWKKNDFDMNSMGSFYGILYCQKVGLNDSWAVLFYASTFLKNKLVLYPGKSLTLIGGADGSGTHKANNQEVFANMTLADHPLVIPSIPIVEDKNMYNAFSRFYGRNVCTESFKYRYNRFKSFIRRLFGLDHR